MTTRTGTFWKWYNNTLVLAQVADSSVALISMNGNRLCDAVNVKDIYEITEAEFKLISGGEEVTSIENPFKK